MENPIYNIVKNTIWPIKTISVATPATEVPMLGVLRISWDMMTNEETKLGLFGETSLSDISRLPDKMYALPAARPEEIEAWLSEVGWSIGAGYMYRWNKAPGRPYDHLWGNLYTIGDSPMVEESPDIDSEELAEATILNGVWEWEINCAWKKAQGSSAEMFESWRKNDPSLEPDGRRSIPFPGWSDSHPWKKAENIGEGYESRYYFCKPKQYVKYRDVLPKNLLAKD